MSQNIAISKLKSNCLQILENIRVGKKSITVTKRAKPIAKIVPFEEDKTSIMRLLRHKAEIKGDIIRPIDEKWDVDEN
jgi:prevent-host-death family protein